MSELHLFAPPRFTARVVARVIGQRLNRRLDYQEAVEEEDLDGLVIITANRHIQVGADYLVVCAWPDDQTLVSWPARPNIPWALLDLREALDRYPEAGP